MAWDDFLGGDQVTTADPLEALRAIAGAAPPQNLIAAAAGPRVPNVPASAIPSKPLPPAPGPIESAVQPGGAPDWQALLAQLGPLLGSFAMHDPAQRTGFLNGYQQGQQLGQVEKEKKQAAVQAKNQAAANFLLEAGQHALAIDDPVQRSQFVDLMEQSGITAGLLQPNDPRVAKLRDVPPSQLAQAKTREAKAIIQETEANGYNVDNLAKSGATHRMSDGSSVPFSVLLDVANVQPIDASNQPVAKPPKDKRGFTKVDAMVTGADGKASRQEVNYDPDTGKYTDPDTGAVIPSKSVQKYDAAQRIAPGSVDAQFNDLVELWKSGNPGKEPPPDVRVKLRVQAKKDIGQADDRPPVTLNVPGLSDVTPAQRVETATDMILSGQMAPSQLTTFFSGMGRESASQLRSFVLQRIKQKQPDFNIAAAESNYQFGKSSGTQTTVRMIDNISKSIPILEKASDDFKRDGVRIINRATLATKEQFGDTSVAAFQTARLGLADEIAKILSGGGTGSGTSDAKLKQANDLLAADMTPDQLRAVTATVKELLQTRRGSLTQGTFMQQKSTDEAGPTPKRLYYDADGKPVNR